MNAILNAASITGQIGAGSIVLNDYALNITPIERGYRLEVARGSEVQTMDIMDGAQGQKGDKGDKGDTGAQGEPGKDAPQDVVRYAAQSLVAEQQAQARENIGAADASSVAELKDDLRELIAANEPVSFVSGGYIKTGNIGSVGTTVSLKPVSNSSYSYAIVECAEGDSFVVKCTGGSSARAWAFVDADDALISNSATGGIDVTIVAPSDSAKVIFNDNTGAGSVFKVVGNDGFIELKSRVDGIGGRVDTLEATVYGVEKYVATTGSDANDGNSSDAAYASIWKALSTGANVIHVANGTYTETPSDVYKLYVNRSVRIIADNATVITPSVLHFRFAHVEIYGINVKVTNPSSETTSGIFLMNCQGRLTDCTVDGAPYMGFRLDGSKLTLERCTSTNNGIDGFNGHTINDGYDTDCTFIDCVASGNGDDGLSVHEHGRIHVIGGQFYDNLSAGIAPNQFCDFEIRNARICGNGTGIEAENHSYTDGDTKAKGVIVGCIISDNNKEGRSQTAHIGYGVWANQYLVTALCNAVVDNSNGTYFEDTGGEITVLLG